ncbi:MAG: hypothetical protein U9P37_06095 [Pseudomonadota bacterium]|nr:hypothetical protein [Pseudomonadota bacterium]
MVAALNVHAATHIITSWNANSESDLTGYNIYRSTTPDSGYSKLNSSIIPKAESPSYVDTIKGKVQATYYYVVTAVDGSGNESVFSSEGDVHLDNMPPASPRGIKKHFKIK